MSRFEGQSAIVTGAATGIGESTARLLAREGAEVALMDLDGEGAGTVAESINGSGGRAHAAAVDLTDWEATGAAVEEVRRRAAKIDRKSVV